MVVIIMNVENLWNNFLDNIKENLMPLAFETWFSDTKLISLDDGIAKIQVPMNVHKKHLKDNYYELINNTFNEITGTNFEFEFLLEEECMNSTNNVEKKEEGVPFNNPAQANLNSKYLFETFIVGESNRFAHAAALAVAENPGKVYNPLFLYGSSGLGKTHLMHSIGNYVIKNTNKKVLYVTSEKFIEDFSGISKKDKSGTNFDYADFFKDKYRNIDVLIIDDIQFLGGATQSQTEFFHTFNKLYEEEKQIIISSDRSPDDLKVLEERLRTRFNWGLTVNIYPPDFNLRYNILKKKIDNQAITKDIDDNVIEYIANNFEGDVRQLEGALTRVLAFSTMFNKKEINLETAVEALKDYLNKNITGKNMMQKIQNCVSKYYNVSIEDLKSKKRNANIAHARQLCMYLTRILTDAAYTKIGIEYGGKDHTTVMHSIEKIEKEIKNDENFKQVVEKLKKDLS